VSESDLPPDVRTVLRQLHLAAADAIDRGDVETGRSAVDSAETVTRTKVPPGSRREQLQTCHRAVERTLAADDHDVAAEYLRRMADRLR